ncbi:myosin-10-like isoform X2 [Sitophilus oryzae]|uniref:Myosin-10-like isoform X2 n=1 Tax=Sitophilus oryzae TaxID=7048 RepID=A0A6J2X3Q5_SITOR|nr:myosin-10-like isoform X2 [Sitophilus oryzae]
MEVSLKKDFETTPPDEEFCSTSALDMDGTQLEKLDTDYQNTNETVKSTPRSGRSNASSSEVFTTSTPRSVRRQQSSRTPLLKSSITRPSPVCSSIPLPVKNSGPIKIPVLLKNARSTSKTSSMSINRTNTVANKHTLEIQFINKNKRYVQMKKELVEKQKPVVDLYQNLIQIKKRLEELGKNVKLDDLRLVPLDEFNKPSARGGGEQVSVEVVGGMKKSIEEIPKTLMDICRNLLSRRALIVELLESVTRSEIDVGEVSDKIESLKNEGQQLQHSLDGIIAEHQDKIDQLVTNWQKLLSEQKSSGEDSRVAELEDQLKEQQRLANESTLVIHDLQRKMEDKRGAYEKSVAELNGVISTLKDQIKKLEQDLENERKSSVDFKSRSNANAQNLKNMRAKIAELEGDKKASETTNTELQRKIRHLQDQMKQKESQWIKEKEDLTKNIKHQENLLQKLTADKNQFETRLGAIEDQKVSTEEELRNAIEHMDTELVQTKTELAEVTVQRNEALEKCSEFEGYIARMGIECKETMNKVSCSINWGKGKENNDSVAEDYIQDIAKDLRIRELEDKIGSLERERILHFEEKRQFEEDLSHEPTETERQLGKQQEYIARYQLLLEESENKLREKFDVLRSTEVANLRSEIRQLKVRQEALEEQNFNCPTEELQKMVEEGRYKLNELMKKSIESEQKLEHYSSVIEKQTQQMSEMENLLRYRENMAGVLKASRDELVLEKESLTRYSQEMRTVLAEVTKEGKIKDRLIKELQEKIDLRERQINKLEKEVRELEANLMMTNEKRFKLQETIGAMEKELQSTKAHVNQLADINTRYETQFRYLNNVNAPQRYSPRTSVMCLHMKRCQSFSTNTEALPLDLPHPRPSVTRHNQYNSRSLIGLSLQTVDFLKNRLNYLNAMNAVPEVPLKEGPEQRGHGLDKVLELTAKRYQYLQHQANESYADLTSLVKFAVTRDAGDE